MGLRRPASGGRQVALTFTSRSRNSKSYLKLLRKIERAIPRGIICLIADNPKQSKDPRQRPGKEVARRASEDRARFHIPKGAAWLNLIEGWWRIFRRQAFAGQCFADSYEIDLATRAATRQLAKPQSQALGLGSSSQTAEVSEAYVCVPPLRNGAVGVPLATAPSLQREE